VIFHVDAVQAAGREPIDVQAIGADLLSLSAHKMHGPKGIGALFLCRERVARIDPLLHGGDQERGLRPGTLATHQCVGMGMAAALALERGPVERAAVQALRDQLWAVLREIPGVHLNGHPERRACHILNVSIAGVEGESLMFALAGLAVSQGSSCTAGRGDPSAVLRAMGRGESLARSSVRFSFGRTNTQADVAAAADAVRRAVAHLRRIAPGGGLAERS
jgi:cysteine desulfurase